MPFRNPRRCAAVLKGFLLIAALALPAVAAMAQNSVEGYPEPVYDIRDFGATGDGVTDDYPAIRAAYEAINAAGGGTLQFPPGTYLIDRFRTRDNDVALSFTGCDGLVVEGYGAKFEIKGSFHRPADISETESGYNSVIALQFIQCRNFSVRGFELDGNVQEMTRDPNIIEGPSHGVVTNQCSDYTIEDIYTHHFAGDGIYIGDSGTISDRNGHISRVTSKFNARDGISIIAARGILIRDSVFEHNGWQQGNYPPHNPCSGVNVESSKSLNLDIKTGDITFDNCTFKDNRLSQVQAASIRKENITFRNSVIDRGISDYVNTINFAGLSGVLENCTLTVEQIVPSWDPHPGTSTTIRNCVIRSDYRGVTDWVSTPGRSVLIENNQFIGTYAAPVGSDIQMPMIHNPDTIFRNNTIFIPKEAKNPNVTAQKISLVTLVQSSSGNTYQTNYITNTNAHFYTDYSGTDPAVITLEQYPNERFYRRGANASYSAVTQLGFVAQPGGAVEGIRLNAQPVVAVRDSYGNVNSAYNGPVTVSIKAGTGVDGSTLLGTQTVQAVQGIATFTDLAIQPSGPGYVLRASSGALFRDSLTFDVSPPSFTLGDVAAALRKSCGLSALTTEERIRYDIVQSGTSLERVDILDVNRILRKVTGLDNAG